MKTDFLALSYYLSGSRRKSFGISDPYFSFNKNKVHMGGFEEPKMLTRNMLIYEEENTLAAVIYFSF